MSPEKDFEKKMNQLIHLLKDIMLHLPSAGSMPEMPAPDAKSQTGMNLNLCFFTFLPMAPEEFEEFEELYEQCSPHEDKGGADHLPGRLTPEDMDFLRQHGIRY